jgi:hypothetical protein
LTASAGRVDAGNRRFRLTFMRFLCFLEFSAFRVLREFDPESDIRPRIAAGSGYGSLLAKCPDKSQSDAWLDDAKLMSASRPF